jgi:hypothetical protein
MGERDRNQSYGRNEGGYDPRDDSYYRSQHNQAGHNQRDDQDDYRRFQGREQGHLAREYNADRHVTGGRNQDERRYQQEERDRSSRHYETQARLPNVYGSYDERFDRDQDRFRRSEYEPSYARDERERALQGSYNYQPNQNYGERTRAYGFERNRGFGSNYNEGPYGSDWNRGSTLQGYPQPQRDFGDRGYSQGNYERGYYSPQRDWNERNFAQRDWGNRAYGEGDYRGYGNQERGRDESWGQQLRDAGHQVAQRVKRAFRGPKGYKRSDERIREDVSDRLAQQDHLDPSEIEVSVANGEVTLTGTVENRNEKFLAEEIADDVSGVNDVHNQLRLRRDQPATQHQGTSAATSTATANNQNSNDPARARNARV